MSPGEEDAVTSRQVPFLRDKLEEHLHGRVSNRHTLDPDRRRDAARCPGAGCEVKPIELSSARAIDGAAGSQADDGSAEDRLAAARPERRPSFARAANFDEAKANPNPELPHPLVLKSGKKVTTPETWWNERRPEIIEDFDREIYGRVPRNVPQVNWEVTSTTHEKVGDVPVVTKHLVGHVDNAAYPPISVGIQLTLTTPANVPGPVPVMMEFGFVFPAGFGGVPKTPMKTASKGITKNVSRPGGFGPGGFGGFGGGPTWQEQVLAKGWGYAIIVPNSIQADNGAGLTKGIIGLCNKGQPRQPEDWARCGPGPGAPAGARLLQDRQGSRRPEGGNRGALTVRQGGACGNGLRLAVRHWLHWFLGRRRRQAAPAQLRRAGRECRRLGRISLDGRQLPQVRRSAHPQRPARRRPRAHRALPPRPVFISYGAMTGPYAEGGWVDQRGSFMAAVAAGPVYRLLGKKDLGTSEFPPIETALIDGDIAFRQHKGGHTTLPNWPTFLTFAQRYIKSPSSAR